ncbi:CRAL/TRIO domain protein [Kalaharituber pfeilii]|nr:CRAL/TRIO domain protein [Kalaharituber pfeilii]
MSAAEPVAAAPQASPDSTAALSEKTQPASNGPITAYIPPPHPREASSGKKLTPFAVPAPGCTPAPPTALNSEQESKYNSLLTAVSSPELGLPSPLTASERMWLTRECLLRYLRATKWDLAAAKARVLSSLLWRREYGTESLTAEHISPENETGKQWLLGYDLQGRPCLSLNPARQNTEPSPRQIQHLVYMLERAIDLMPPGQETLALKIDYASAASSKIPSLATGKQALNILQNHYPERLGRAINLSLPWYVWTFYKLIGPFIDPLTREKLVFPGKSVKDEITSFVPKAQLEKSAGGDCDFEYIHEVYWPVFVELCEKRREEYRKRWEALGCKIGESELLLKGGSVEVDLEQGNKE